MPFTDPMADGPAIQAAGLRALKGGQTLEQDPEPRRDFRTSDDTTPIVLMGYYNPIYVYGVRGVSWRRQGGGGRRPDRRRPAAGGGRGALPAGAEGRPQLHPARDADHRRQAPPGGARQHLRLRLLRVDHRRHRRGRARTRKSSARRLRASSVIPICRWLSVSACATRRARRESRAQADGVVVGSAIVEAVRKSLADGKPRQAERSAVVGWWPNSRRGVRRVAKRPR